MTDYAIPADFYIWPSQAARLLKIADHKLDQLRNEGNLHQIKMTPGGKRRYNMREIIRLRETIQPGGAQ